jgi:hypothetical protein
MFRVMAMGRIVARSRFTVSLRATFRNSFRSCVVAGLGWVSATFRVKVRVSVSLR